MTDVPWAFAFSIRRRKPEVLGSNPSRLIQNKMVKKRLYRNTKKKIIAGVCAGLADYLDADPTIVRLIWALATLISVGLGIVAYIVAWIIVPEKGK